jgi:methionine sulfoxide reductase heme-binding subunit
MSIAAASATAGSTPYLWWLVSRASGIVALGLITLTVLIGLTMSTKVLRRPGIGRTLVRLHEHLALVGLGAIAAHGLALLGDPWLHPGIGGLSIPFALSYRPLFTGLGVIGGYLAALLGLSFYVRRRIGVRVWRRLHRATVLVWVLGVVHTLGAGSDAATPWLRALALLPAIPIAYLVALRIATLARRTGTHGRMARPAIARGEQPRRRPAAGAAPAAARESAS